ncbi:Crp/Fnr family transcriptional regulator [Chitinophagaceae bacterium MMS25-I14]
MLNNFLERCNSIYPVSEQLRTMLEAETEIISLPRKHLLLRSGQRSDHVCMVLDGLLRSYYLKDDTDITTRLMPEGYLVISVNSFYTRTPGYEFIETLEPVTLARLHYEQLQRIYKAHMEFNFITRVLTEHYLHISEQRMAMLRNQTGEEKYKYFMEQYPTLLQRVPLKYIATFLNMQQETLSRIRKKFSQA